LTDRAPYDGAGYSVSTAGDVDGDGLSDILVGAVYYDEGGSNAGKAYLVLGSSLSGASMNLSAADHAFIGEVDEDYAGCSVSTAGDVDGDGLSDVLVGADDNDDGGLNAGKAYLVLGSSLSGASMNLSAADHAFIGEDVGDATGVAVSTAGDVDGDGLSDVLVGADENDDGGSSAGKAYLLISP